MASPLSTADANLFQHFRAARQRSRPPWAYPLMSGCVLVTASLLFAMWARAIWGVEQLDRPRLALDLAIAPSPPPPPPPPPGGAKPQAPVIVPRRITVRSIVQPVRREQVPPPAQVAADPGSPDGEPGGIPGGVPGGTPDGQLDSITPPTPPAAIDVPQPPRIVPPSALEASRISGEKQIIPDDVTKIAIERAGTNRVVGTFKVCLTAGGGIASVTALKSTGYPAYDHAITTTITGTWRYRPFLIGGHPAPVCTAVTFIYSQ